MRDKNNTEGIFVEFSQNQSWHVEAFEKRDLLDFISRLQTILFQDCCIHYSTFCMVMHGICVLQVTLTTELPYKSVCNHSSIS